MEVIQVKDKKFEKSISYDKIQSAVKKIADDINRDYKNQSPLFIVILNGAFMFAADLFKHINLDCSITFLKLSSYQGTKSTSKVKKLIGLNEDIKNRKVIIVEDIIDTGITIENTIKSIQEYGPEDTKVCTLLLKPDALVKKVDLEYVGLEIPNDFIVGYGLDYDGFGRNLPDIYKIVE